MALAGMPNSFHSSSVLPASTGGGNARRHRIDGVVGHDHAVRHRHERQAPDHGQGIALDAPAFQQALGAQQVGERGLAQAIGVELHGLEDGLATPQGGPGVGAGVTGAGLGNRLVKQPQPRRAGRAGCRRSCRRRIRRRW